MKINKHHKYILLSMTSIALCSCGIKPSYVEPPQGAEHEQFPRTYPDTSTDPIVGLENKDL